MCVAEWHKNGTNGTKWRLSRAPPVIFQSQLRLFCHNHPPSPMSATSFIWTKPNHPGGDYAPSAILHNEGARFTAATLVKEAKEQVAARIGMAFSHHRLQAIEQHNLNITSGELWCDVGNGLELFPRASACHFNRNGALIISKVDFKGELVPGNDGGGPKSVKKCVLKLYSA